MCSVDPDEIVEMTRTTEGLDISSGNVLCRRCNTEKAVVVLRVKDAYCKDCFLSYFVHKFRSTIGKSKQIRPGDKILIATSGGMSSAALLHLVRDGLNETSHKKLRFDPVFLYIDESCLSESPDSGIEFINQVCSQVSSLAFPCYFIPLEEVMSADPVQPSVFRKDEKSVLHTKLDLQEQMKQLFISCSSESAKQDLKEQLKRELLYQSAAGLGYQKIFVADNATTLSVSILANVAIGRGSQLADRVQFRAQHKDIEVYRPMREILLDEIVYYNKLHDISSFQAPTLLLKGSSITSCTEEFVMGLQKEFPATIPTIFRTGAKLIASSSEVSKCSTPDVNGFSENDSIIHLNTLCAMCGLHTDVVQSESSALHATLISQKLSSIGLTETASQKSLLNENAVTYDFRTSGADPSGSSLSNCGNADDMSNNCCKNSSRTVPSDACSNSQQSGCCKSSSSDLKEKRDSNNIPKETLQKYLCYGCRIMIKDLSEVNHLPVKIRASVAEEERREKMREQIQDFLL